MQVSAMKRAHSVQEQCLLLMLPTDVLNKIAYYVDFCETDEEFVARVKNQKDVSIEHMAQLEKHRRMPIYTRLQRPKPFKPIATYSIDYSKIIFLEKRDDDCCIPAGFNVLDIKEDICTLNRLADSAEYRQYLHDMSKSIRSITLSRDGTMLAEMRTVMSSGRGHTERMFYKDELVVRKGPMNREAKIFTLAEDSHHNTYKIGFNKQGTKIAACSKKRVFDCRDDIISFDLMSERYEDDDQSFLLVSKEEHDARTICSFQNYLQLHMICKTLKA